MGKNIVTKKIKDYFKILKKSISHFGSNNPVGLAGTTAYFAIFSIAPILIIIISVFGYLTGTASIRDKLFEELNTLVGQESANLLQTAIENYQISENSGIGAAVGLVFFLISATTLFSMLQNSINFIWRVQAKSNLKQSIFKLLRDRLFSFGVILGLGFLLLVSLIVDASIAYLKEFLMTYFTPDFIFMAQLLNVVISLGITTTVFAVIYRFLPDVKVHWSASWFGAIFTALFFSLGKFIIGLIIGNSKLGAVYGAASSFVVILVWIYYVSIIFYFGVEVSRQYSIFRKHNNKPLNFAVPFEINRLQEQKAKA